MSRVKMEEKLAVNKYQVDPEPHIKVAVARCGECEGNPCIFVCPADCFKLDDGRMVFSYEGCLDCGSCRIVCSKKAIEWSYPRGGFGICYEYG